MSAFDRFYGLFARRSFIVFHDLAVAVLSFWAAYTVAYGFPGVLHVPGIIEKSVGFTVAAAVSFHYFSVFRGSWRYFSIPELTSICQATLVAMVIYTVAAFYFSSGDNIPRSVPVLAAMFIIVALSSSRLLLRISADGRGLHHAFRSVGGNPKSKRNVLVCGLTDEAEGFIRAVKRVRDSDIVVVGIVDQRTKRQAQSIQGVPVLGKPEQLPALLDKLAAKGVAVRELVIAEHRPARNRVTDLLELGTNSGLKVTRLPEATQMANTSLLEPKAIELSELLGRPEFDVDIRRVARLVEDKVILITGAGGSIGSELCRQIAAFNPRRLILTDSSEFLLYTLHKELGERFPTVRLTARIADVREASRIESLFAEFRPNVVFHAAALKHVPLVEENALEGVITNVLGTRNVADAAMANGSGTFVMISTDKAVNPTSIMGATKRAAEAYCQSLDVKSTVTRFKTVRFGNVLGSNGSVVPLFKSQIAAGGPVTVTHPNVIRFFMTTPEAISLVLHASGRAMQRVSERGKIMVLDMGKPVRIVDLAERMIRLAGFRPHLDIAIKFTGLRPGEKLFEQLLDNAESQESIVEDGILIASPRIVNHSVLVRTIAAIDVAARSGDRQRAIELLSHIVPEYQPSVATANDLDDSRPTKTLLTDIEE